MKEFLENVRKKYPLVHNITNYVTANDCANILLACGASPIMADEIDEVEDIASICSALNINIGTLNKRTIESMIRAGKKAEQLNHPVILDPVGAGASDLRTVTARRLMDQIHFAVIRGNISEIRTLSGSSAATQGVDADVADKVTEDKIDEAVSFARKFSARKSSFSKLLFFRAIPRDPVMQGGCGFQSLRFCTAYNRIQRYITACFLRILKEGPD